MVEDCKTIEKHRITFTTNPTSEYRVFSGRFRPRFNRGEEKMKLIWIDIETSGLNHQSDLLLEIAVAESDFCDPFNVNLIYESVIRVHPTTAAHFDPFIKEMHTKNNLLAECAGPHAKHLYNVEKDLMKLIDAGFDRESQPIMAGSSIHFDKLFILYNMETLIKRFSHRLYDVSAIKMFCESMGMPKIPRAEAHRAKADIFESIDHAKKCSEWLRKSFI